MVELVTHLASIALGALSGAGALWAYGRSRRSSRAPGELERALNIATEAAGISCWEIDTQAGRFVWIDNPYCEIFGDTADPSLASYLEKLQPDDRAMIGARFDQARATGE